MMGVIAGVWPVSSTNPCPVNQEVMHQMMRVARLRALDPKSAERKDDD